METHIITKYAELTKYDKAPMGTVVHVDLEKKSAHYIQVSPNSDEPIWVTTDLFLGTVFGDLVEHRMFIEEALRIYHNKKNNPLFNIIKIMSELNQ